MAPYDPAQVPTLVHTAFGTLPASAALRVPRLSQATLAALLPGLAYGKAPRDSAVQLLLTRGGLLRLGVPEAEIGAVSKELLLGIRSLPSRQRLGDVPPATDFDWDDRDHDALLLLYGADAAAVDALLAALPALDTHGPNADGPDAHGPAEPAPAGSAPPPLRSYLPENNREPFGFRDGISTFDLVPEPRRPNELPLGEAVLGQPDMTGAAPASTALGDHGSLVAVMELHQDVQAYWSYWLSCGSDVADAVLLAAKGVGRWPNGMPLLPGQRTEPAFDESALEIRSFAADPRGTGCPFGSHVRRANPRDTLVPEPELSLRIARLHQFLRRGRLFGPPAPRSAYPEPLQPHMPDGAADTAASPRGLFFVALAGDLRRQLEFNVQNWLLAPKHANLWDEVDPVLGRAGDAHRFSVPTDGVARHVDGIGDWVRPRGGGYYLLPSLKAMERLARGWRSA